jgi:hypothetical protein
MNRKDNYRLPEGMQRVGYDADTERYTYKQTDGSYWEGAEGARYGTLRRGMLVSSSYPKTYLKSVQIANKQCSQNWLRAYTCI